MREVVTQYAVVLYSGPGLVDLDRPALLARSLVEPMPPSALNVLVLGIIAAALWVGFAFAPPRPIGADGG